MTKTKNGAVFTQRWVVEMILDCCGYDSDLDLVDKLVVEPSFGQGAFLFPIVQRLLESMKRYSKSPELLKRSLRAFEINEADVRYCRLGLRKQLVNFGIDRDLSEEIIDSWLLEEDYLTNCQLGTADFVIGNPPYIRGTAIEGERRKTYIKTCKTMTPGTDIYIGFIETALKSLSVNGVMSFICADRWMHNAYGKKLRRLIVDQYAMELVLKMHDVDAFENRVSAYPAIIQIRNAG